VLRTACSPPAVKIKPLWIDFFVLFLAISSLQPIVFKALNLKNSRQEKQVQLFNGLIIHLLFYESKYNFIFMENVKILK